MSPEKPEQDPKAIAPSEVSEEEQLLRLIEKPVNEVIDRYIEADVQFEKQWQLLRLDKVDKYVRGIQFVEMDDRGGYYGWQAVTAGTNLYDDDADSGCSDYNLDIVDSYRKKYIATLGLRPFWNASAVPDDPQSEVDRKAARNANLAAVWMRSKWNARTQNIVIFDRQFQGGTVYIHNPFVADKDLFGETEEPEYRTKIEQVPSPVDPLSGVAGPPTEVEVPEFIGNTKYPGTGPAFHVYDGSMVTVPFNCRDFSKLPWLLLEKEENRGALLQLYGDVLRSRMKDTGELSNENSSSTTEQGRQTRGSAESLTGNYRPGSESTWTHQRYWLATTQYELVHLPATRETLYEKFPLGIHVAKVEGITVRVENSGINAEWGCIKPFPGSTVYQDPVAYSILGNQDIINFVMNIAVAREERGLPTAICDAELIDTDEMNRQRYRPNEVIPAKASFGGSLREAMVSLPTPNKDDGAGAYLTNAVLANTESHLGLLKATWGGQSEQKTATGQRMELQQGLMQLGVPGEMVSQGWADAYTRGCRLLAENAPKGFMISDGSTSEMLDLEALKNGKYHFEVDPGMPMTRAEQADMASGIIKENPELAGAMGFMSPLAASALRDLLIPGMRDIPAPLADVRDKVIQRIQILLEQQPVPGQPDPLTGQPGPLMPSIMPEDYVDDPAQHAKLVQEWLNTAAGRKINPFLGGDPKNMPGYQNVVAYGMHCDQKAMPPPPPPTPPKVSVSVSAPELLIPGVPEAVNATAGTALPPAPQQQPMMPGAPPMDGMPPQGPPQGQQQFTPPLPTGPSPAPAPAMPPSGGSMQVQ